MSRTSLHTRSFWRITIPVFVLFVVLNYLPVLQGKIPFPRDLVLGHAAWEGLRPETLRSFAGIIDVPALSYPFHALAGRAARKGSLALWNPYILGGSPFLANSQSALFYPLNAMYYVLPVPAAWMLALTIRMFLAGLFMALFVRALGGTAAGCIVSGMIFSACGFMTAWQGQAIGDGAIWLPLICYSVHRLHRAPSARSVGLGAISFAMPALAGHPETAFHLALTGAALAFVLWLFPWDAAAGRFDLRFLAAFAAIGVLAMGLASVQMLPTLEWLPHLNQKLDQPEPARTRHDAQGFFSRDIGSDPNSAFIPIPEGASFAGVAALLLAAVALSHRDRHPVVFFAAVTVLAVAIAYSVQPIHTIVVHLPLIKAMKNARFILIATFGIASMAGLGASLLEEKAPRNAGRTPWLLLGAAFVVVLFGVFEVHRATARAPSFMTGPGGSLVFLILASILLAARLRGMLSGRPFAFLVCGLTAIELLSFSHGFFGFAPVKEIFPRPPVFDFLARQGDPSAFRIAKAGYPIPANSGMMYGIQMAEGYDICTERTRLFTRGLTEMRDDGVFFLSDRIAQNRDRRLDMLNVKYLVVITPSVDFDRLASQAGRFEMVYRENSIAVFENKSVLARAFVVPQDGAEVVADPAAQLDRLKDPEFDPLRRVVIPEPLPAAGPGDSPFTSGVQLLEARNNSSAFQTRTPAAGVFVLSQMYYPGWRATVDGREAKVLAVDFALTGIALPAGTHEVRFTFEPRSFKIGAVISLVSLAAIAGLLIKKNPRQTRISETQEIRV